MPGACDSKATNNRCRRGSRQPPGPLPIAGPGCWCTQRTSMTRAPKISSLASSPCSAARSASSPHSTVPTGSTEASRYSKLSSASDSPAPPRSTWTGNGPAGHPAAGPGRSPPAPSRRPGRSPTPASCPARNTSCQPDPARNRPACYPPTSPAAPVPSASRTGSMASEPEPGCPEGWRSITRHGFVGATASSAIPNAGSTARGIAGQESGTSSLGSTRSRAAV